MAVQLRNNRLAPSMVISVLLHLLVFFCFGLLLQLHATKPKERSAANLEVRLIQSLPPNMPAKPGKKLLVTSAPAQLKVTQPAVQNPPDSAQPSARVAEQTPAPAAEVAGVAFPGAVATPWPSQLRADNSVFRARSAQQDAARAYHQQAMEAQVRQQSEQRAQLMIQQLQQLLANRLDVQPAVTGKCMLAEKDGVVSNRLVCDSPALHQLLYKDEKNVTGMLIALRGIGRMLNGFSAEIHADRFGIILVEQ